MSNMATILNSKKFNLFISELKFVNEEELSTKESGQNEKLSKKE